MSSRLSSGGLAQYSRSTSDGTLSNLAVGLRRSMIFFSANSDMAAPS